MGDILTIERETYNLFDRHAIGVHSGYLHKKLRAQFEDQQGVPSFYKGGVCACVCACVCWVDTGPGFRITACSNAPVPTPPYLYIFIYVKT